MSLQFVSALPLDIALLNQDEMIQVLELSDNTVREYGARFVPPLSSSGVRQAICARIRLILNAAPILQVAPSPLRGNYNALDRNAMAATVNELAERLDRVELATPGPANPNGGLTRIDPGTGAYMNAQMAAVLDEVNESTTVVRVELNETLRTMVHNNPPD